MSLADQAHPMGDRLALVSLVSRYRASWEVYLDETGIWVARGISAFNCWARLGADAAMHLEQKMTQI
jgi:hypothetical protein